MNSDITMLQDIIDKSKNIVFFGGAGTSTDCGLPDFRGTEGLYTKNTQEKYGCAPEFLLSSACYYREPELFFEYFRKNMIFDYAKPGILHEKLAKLEAIGKLKAIVTQNIDGLHQKAGSKNVIEIHGSTSQNKCRGCGKIFDEQFMKNSIGIPHCECGGIVKPMVTLYGESLPEDAWNKAVEALGDADTLIVGGTSLSVYPASTLVDYFYGDNLVIINNQATIRDQYADLVINQNLTEVFKSLNI